jgi:hypothetical protein
MVIYFKFEKISSLHNHPNFETKTVKILKFCAFIIIVTTMKELGYAFFQTLFYLFALTLTTVSVWGLEMQ